MDWLQIGKDFGTNAVVLVALGVAIWRVMVWFGREIIIPVRDRLLTRLEQFFDGLDVTLNTLTENVGVVSVHMQAQTRSLERLESQCAERHRTAELARQEIGS